MAGVDQDRRREHDHDPPPEGGDRRDAEVPTQPVDLDPQERGAEADGEGRAEATAERIPGQEDRAERVPGQQERGGRQRERPRLRACAAPVEALVVPGRDVVPDLEVPVGVETLRIEQVDVLIAGRRERGGDVRGQEGVEEEGDPEEAGRRAAGRPGAGLRRASRSEGISRSSPIGPGSPTEVAAGPGRSTSPRRGDPGPIGDEDRPENLGEEHLHEEHGERLAPGTDRPPCRHQEKEEQQERVAPTVPRPARRAVSAGNPRPSVHRRRRS